MFDKNTVSVGTSALGGSARDMADSSVVRNRLAGNPFNPDNLNVADDMCQWNAALGFNHPKGSISDLMALPTEGSSGAGSYISLSHQTVLPDPLDGRQ